MNVLLFLLLLLLLQLLLLVLMLLRFLFLFLFLLLLPLPFLLRGSRCCSRSPPLTQRVEAASLLLLLLLLLLLPPLVVVVVVRNAMVRGCQERWGTTAWLASRQAEVLKRIHTLLIGYTNRVPALWREQNGPFPSETAIAVQRAVAAV